MNALVGKELSIITHKAQTTRHRILGIVNGPDFQMVLSDTPGVIKPAYEMQTSMMNFVKEALVDADVLLYMVTAEEKELKEERFFEKKINGIEITESGILAAAHLAGAGNVKKFLRSNGTNCFSDAYGAKLSTYLRKFAGYDVSVIQANRKARV